MNNPLRMAVAAALAAMTSGCGQGIPQQPMGGSSFDTAHSPAALSTTTKIKHVIVLVQENRSFDNLFATFPGLQNPITKKNGVPVWRSSKHGTVTFRKADLHLGVDLGHTYWAFANDVAHGQLDGFDRVNYWNPRCHCFTPAGTLPYQYVDPAQIAPYWTLAKRYVLADNMYPTQGSGSFTAHLNLIRGGTRLPGREAQVADWPATEPWGCDSASGSVTNLVEPDNFPWPSTTQIHGGGPFPCYGWHTMRDLLDAKGVSWKYYAPLVCNTKGAPPCSRNGEGGTIWNPFDAIRAVRYGPEWTTKISSPETNVFTDISSGRLPAVAWITPDAQNSDHPAESSDTGPSWVAQVVNAVGHSKYWNSTAIVVVWDDWGGFVDHVMPSHPRPENYGGLGLRVPAIIVSPYAMAGVVSHTQYEFGSILRFMEDNWQLGSLQTSDATSNSIADAFDFKKPPRAFAPVAAKYSKDFFVKQTPSHAAVDDE